MMFRVTLYLALLFSPLFVFAESEHPGEVIYEINCSACHHLANEVVGPSLVEIAKTYPVGKKQDFVKWAKTPGKKNPKMIQMPSMAHVPDADLEKVHDYLLKATEGVKKARRDSLFPKFQEPNRPLPYVARASMPDSSPASIGVVLSDGVSLCWDTEACRFRYAYQGSKTNLFSMWRPASLPGKPYYRETSEKLFADHGEAEFLGYRLIDRNPEFHYRIDSLEIRELIANDPTEGAFIRRFKIEGLQDSLVLDLTSEGSAVLTSDRGVLKNGKLTLSSEDASLFTLKISAKNWKPASRKRAKEVLPRVVRIPTFPSKDPSDWLHYYTIYNVPLPAEVDHQVGGITTLKDGRIAACFNSGEVQIYSPQRERWTQFARGLSLPLGLVEEEDGSLVVMQWAELTRLRDADRDGTADHYENLCDDFGITGNYHEFAYGPARDSKGNFFFALNVASNGAGIQDMIRGPWNPIGLEREIHLASNGKEAWQKNKTKAGRMYSRVPYRGCIIKVTPDKKSSVFAYGFRSPDGIHVDSEDRLWVTDNQGDWRGTSPLYHVTEGGFYGHPASLVWKKGWTRNPLEVPVGELEEMRTAAAALFAHGELANSPTQPIDTIDPGLFGLPGGELLIGEMNQPQLIRFLPDEVNGVLQGTLLPFLFSADLGIGSHRLTFDGEGNLWIGKTHIKWAGDEGLKKVVWNEKEPLLVSQVRLLPNGFKVFFNRPVLKTSTSVKVSSHGYKYHKEYGSPKVDLQEVRVEGQKLSDDGKSLFFEVPNVVARRVYTIELEGLADADGLPLMDKVLRYNVVETR